MNRHKLKEIQKHGEAGSVDIATVKAEQAHIKELVARFQPEDQWNVNESALFAFAPPDHGLSQRQMSGKHVNKFWVTLAFTTQLAQRKWVYSSLGSLKSLNALVDKARSSAGFIITQIKLLG